MGNHAVSDRTLQKYWRLAVLALHHNRCIICGKTRQPEDLECHHIIKRGHRVTRHDVKNGVPVCITPIEIDGQITTCHKIAHTKVGQRIIDGRLGASHCEYLDEREKVMIKDYKNALSYSTKELEKYELEKLKKVIGNYQED